MSVRVMTAVWDNTPYEGGELLVLLPIRPKNNAI